MLSANADAVSNVISWNKWACPCPPCRRRGWDAQTGRPTVARLRQLGLADVAAELSQAGLTHERSA